MKNSLWTLCKNSVFFVVKKIANMFIAIFDFFVICFESLRPRNLDLWKIAIRNLFRNKRRTILISISIAGAVIGLTWMSGWMIGMMREMNEMVIKGGLAHVQITHEKYRDDPGLQFCIENPDSIIEKIRHIEAIEKISPRISVEGMISSAGNSAGVLLQGIDPEIEGKISLVGEAMTEGALSSINDGKNVVLSQSLAEKLNVKLKSKIVIMGSNAFGEVEMESVRVSGIFHTGYGEYDQFFVFLSLPTLQEMFGLENAVTSIAISVNEKSNPTAIRDKIHSELHAPRYSLEIVSWIEIAPTMIQMMNEMENMLYAFYSIFYIAMAFGLINTMLMAIFERRRELGVLLAIGMTPRRLKTMIMLESAMITAIAAFLGTVLAIAISEIFIPDGMDLAIYADALEDFGLSTKIPFVYSWGAVLIPFTSAIFFGMIAGFFPARRAAKMNPVESIRAI